MKNVLTLGVELDKKKWKNKIVQVTKMHRRKSKRKHEFFIVALRGKFYKLGHGPSLQ